MRVIKITAIWCSACLIMNKVWSNILKKYDIPTIELDLDRDVLEVENYQPGSVLPVFIFEQENQEIKRVVGEISEKELIKIIEELGFHEKNH